MKLSIWTFLENLKSQKFENYEFENRQNDNINCTFWHFQD